MKNKYSTDVEYYNHTVNKKIATIRGAKQTNSQKRTHNLVTEASTSYRDPEPNASRPSGDLVVKA